MTKQEYRKIALKRLKSIPKRQRYLIDKKLNKALYELIKSRQIKSAMLYVPLGIEVNITPLINKLRREGVLVLVPFMEGESFRLVKYRLPLERKIYGIREPNISNQFRKKKIDIAIVPIVATDSSYKRVGFGKGMYDRFFAKDTDTVQEIIFTQRVLCQCTEDITDSYDIRADQIVACKI